MARRIGVTPAAYSRIEAGKVMPRVPKLRQICHVLGISSDTLLGLQRSEVTAWVETPSTDAEVAPELPRLARTLRTLPDTSLRALQALASALTRTEGGDTPPSTRSP